MRKIYSLIKETLCYKIIKADKEKNMLSHAYFISCQDEVMQRDYLKILASLLLCDKDDPCFNCRTCDLILKESLPDLKVYPKNKNIIVEDVNEIVADNYVRPLEKDRKVYILSNCDNMNFQAQNKLLKVLHNFHRVIHTGKIIVAQWICRLLEKTGKCETLRNKK